MTDNYTDEPLPTPPSNVDPEQVLALIRYTQDGETLLWSSLNGRGERGGMEFYRFQLQTMDGHPLRSYADWENTTEWQLVKLSSGEVYATSEQVGSSTTEFAKLTQWGGGGRKFKLIASGNAGSQEAGYPGVLFRRIKESIKTSRPLEVFNVGSRAENATTLLIGPYLRLYGASEGDIDVWEYLASEASPPPNNGDDGDLREQIDHVEESVDDPDKPFGYEWPDERYKTVMAKLKDERNVIVEGVAGCGKTHLLKKIKESKAFEGRLQVVVFHPSTTYEDFVVGLHPVGNEFPARPGVFVEMCIKAAKDPTNPHLLFIDEINRANTSKVLGDLLMPIEKSKRKHFGENDGKAVTAEPPGDGDWFVRLQTSFDDPDGELQENGKPEQVSYLRVPSNLYILGTMNTTDRSVGTIDLALRRRFYWVTMDPLSGEKIMKDEDFEKKFQKEDTGEQEKWKGLVGWFDWANDYLKDHIGADARLGHSYFFESDWKGTKENWKGTKEKLLAQLAEIAATFRLKKEDLINIFTVEGISKVEKAEDAGVFIQAYGRASQRPIVNSEFKFSFEDNNQASSNGANTGSQSESASNSGDAEEQGKDDAITDESGQVVDGSEDKQ